MQIIQQIRDKGAAIVIGVIALSLIGFILMDANLGSSRMSASGASTIGAINGNDISNNEYQAKVKQLEDQYGGRVTGAQSYYLRQSAWDQLVAEKVLMSEFEKLGLNFTPKELASVMFSEDAPQSLKQAFTDQESGRYDIAKVEQWWNTIAKKAKGEQKAAIETQVVEPIRIQALYGKYSSMIAASGYYPTWMKDKEAVETKRFATLSFVAVPYNVIADSTVKVSDEDVTAYVAKHKALYKQDGGRYISYVTFNANPSAKDTQTIFSDIDKLKQAFATDTNNTVFVAKNMSTRKLSEAYILKSKLTFAQKDSVTALPVNGVWGPYLDGKEVVLAKLLGSKSVPDSIKCRHILIATTDAQSGQPIMSDSLAKLRIDSIELAIKSGASFDDLEATYSTDKVAHKDKGVMTFSSADVQNKERFAPEFGAFLMAEGGEQKKTVKTNFGWHYIEILEKKNFEPAYKIAYIAREIVPSPETVNGANAMASKLSGEARDAKALEAYVAKNGLQKLDVPTLIKENDFQLGALQDARQIVKWAFGAKQGEVSEPFSVGEQFVVAMVAKVQPEGLPDAKAARPQTEQLIKNEKKAELIKTKLTATPTLESAAAAYSLQQLTAGADSTVTFNAQFITGIGEEPKVVGAVFNKTYQTKVSEPIVGKNGVYVLKVNGYGDKAIAVADAAKAASERTKALAGQISSGWFESLKGLSTIKDERSKIN